MSGNESSISRLSEHRTVLETHGYTVREVLGKGSYAVVRRSRSERHDREVAIKIISKRRAPHDYLQKFLPRELAVIRHLRHPNVVNFLQCIETTNRVYIVMDLAVNGDLLEYIKKMKKVDEKTGCRWFHHLVEGVAYCHGKGIVHRDLKCENLLLNDNYVLKLTDFGFARGHLELDIEGPVVNKKKTLSKTFCGSYAYAPPEILKGQPYEPHLADVWSMGVILFTMLCGRLPFDDTNHKKLIQQVEHPVHYPSSSTISAEVRSLIARILARATGRVYIPEIRRDRWYVENYDPDWRSLEESESDSLQSTGRRLTEKSSVEKMAPVKEKSHEKHTLWEKITRNGN